MTAGPPVLETRGLTKRFGGLVAVDQLSITVPRAQIRGLIGPNGSGKTTTVNVLSGLYRADGGEIHLCGRRTDKLRPHEITACGIARTFQIPKLFGHMTVLENVLLPALAALDRGAGGALPEITERARGLLDFVTLDRLRHAPAKELSGGQSMLIQIARALMVRPLHLILMDEPFAGVHPSIRDIILEAILKMNREEEITFLIVSHEMAELRRLCQRVSVMDEGRLIAEGTLEEVANNPLVLEAYCKRDNQVFPGPSEICGTHARHERWLAPSGFFACRYLATRPGIVSARPPGFWAYLFGSKITMHS